MHLLRFIFPVACAASVAAIALWTERFFGHLDPYRVALVCAFYLMLALSLHVVTRRPTVATLLALSLVAGFAAISKAMFNYTARSLHFVDLYYYFKLPAELVFFARHYTEIAAMAAALVISIATALIWLWRTETRSAVTCWTVAALAASYCVFFTVFYLVLVNDAQRGDRAFQHAYNSNHASAWMVSLRDVFSFAGVRDRFAGPKISASIIEPTRAGPSVGVSAAEAPLSAPNIILVLHESIIDPRPFTSDENVFFTEDPFVSGDGVSRQLIVETYGGITWISEYGAILGLSTHYLRPLHSYLGHFMQGKFKHALPHALAAHGYGLTFVYPAQRSFVNTGRFYKALGFERIIDFADQKPSFWVERDRFHFNHAIADIKARRASGDKRPVFSFVMTSATHAPWSKVYFPDVRPNEARPGNEWAEYARRVRIAHDDMKELKQRLAAEFPAEQFVIVGFGDHQPILTRAHFSQRNLHQMDDADLRTSAIFESFYRIDGVNFIPAYDEAPKRTEIGYLANIVLSAARLPLAGTFQMRRDLMRNCAGLLFRCANQVAVMELHREIINRGEIIFD